MPPKEAIDYFKRKKALPPDKFYELESEARAGAFAIANVYETDVTTALQKELIDALETGKPQKQVIDRLKKILAGAGHKELGNNHLETVFRTTMSIAYGVGRRVGMEEASDLLPFWEYSSIGDDRTRPTHRALDGSIYPANHPFWNQYYPPWDFRCRCTVIATLEYRKGYDHSRPNDSSNLEYDQNGLPERANVDGEVVRIKGAGFDGIPPQANLKSVLQESAKRALKSRKQK